MNPPVPNPFDKRVSEAQVAAVLACIADPPGRRTRPHKDDAPGDFDFWFNGGACKYHTGSAHYQFKDGTIAIVAVPATRLWVRIRFPESEAVEITQA